MFSNNLITKFNSLDTPFYFYDLELLDKTLSILSKSIYDNYNVYYAIKANNNRSIIDKINKYKFGIDAVSINEIIKAIDLGFDSKKIVFAGVGKKEKEIELAIQKNIYLFNCESIQEIELIDKISYKMKKKSDLAVRLNPNIDSMTHKYIKTGIYDSKFGIQIKDLPILIEKINDLQNITLKGFHFHLGSQINDFSVFSKLAEVANDVNKYFMDKGFNIQDINLGGGLGINYEDPDNNLIPDFKSYFNLFKKELKVFDGQKIHFELGRSIVAQSGSLISRILYIKNSFNRNFLILDAGMTELIRPALYNSFHHIQNLSSNEKKIKYDIVGPLCESSDTFIKDFYLNKADSGNLLAIRSVGAYGEVMSSNYNLRKKAPSYYSDNFL